ncbi:glycosyl hydrolase [Paenibacillus solisilvae]|uniref:Glycosyl hydrolase n=1 Tax=Paenibacillus solisilvae TaxID=2486751 RepID=A0ABW0VZU8_9BACL
MRKTHLLLITLSLAAAAVIVGILLAKESVPAEVTEAESLKGTSAAETAIPMTFEAESGQLQGDLTIGKQPAGFSGSGYVTGFKKPGDSVTIPVTAPADDIFELIVGYNGPSGDKDTELAVNGIAFGSVNLRKTAGFTEVSAGKIALNRGENTITFNTGWGWYDIDYVKITNAAKNQEHQVVKGLVNPNATPEALALQRYLVDSYGTSILSGQQNLNDALELKKPYGKLPAIVGFDMMDYSPSRVEHGAKSMEIDNALLWHDLGGIAAFTWHWNAPTDLIDSGEKPWSSGFYTEATTFDLENALADPDSKSYKLLLRDMDAIAEQLKKLQDAKIPVLWRPLHEAEGGWFWWGAKGPEPCKQLWKLLYDRLTNVHHLNNLIWVWNSESPDWYPGDDTVDIISVDSYPAAGDYSPDINRYENLVKLVQDKKLVAMAENGPIPDPDLLTKLQANWSWYCTWGGEFINDGKQNTKEHIQKVLDSSYVITLDELPDFSTY